MRLPFQKYKQCHEYFELGCEIKHQHARPSIVSTVVDVDSIKKTNVAIALSDALALRRRPSGFTNYSALSFQEALHTPLASAALVWSRGHSYSGPDDQASFPSEEVAVDEHFLPTIVH